MRNLFLLALLFTFLNSNCQENQYPTTKKVSVIDTFYKDFIIKDEYRWLEDIDNIEVRNWINSQNKLSKKELKKGSTKNKAFNTIDKYFDTKYTTPIKKGKYYFTYAYYDNLGVPALFYKAKINQRLKLLIDPNFISSKDKIRIKGYWVSKNSEYLSYQFNRNGSDWTEIKIVNLDTKKELKDHLINIKFSNIVWKENGFFYSKYPKLDKFSPTFGEKIFYHKIGTNQSEDKLIFERKNHQTQFKYTVTSDERFFILKEINEKSGKINIFYIDYASPNADLKPLLMNLSDNLNIVESRNGKLIATTNLNSNNNYVIELNPMEPYNLKVLIPEYEKAILLDIKPLKEKIIAIYQYNQRPIIIVYDYNRNPLYTLELPIATSVSGFYGNFNDNELIFYFTSYTIPPIVYKLDINDYERTLIQNPYATFDSDNIEYTEIEYYSKDSTKVPMFLIHNNDIKLDGNNPTILKAYGGFGSIVQPHFDPGIVYFLNKGGVIAYANVRGGGDNGYSWHQDGRGENKQNSFDDFISAAEYLIQNKYTNPNKLAITGGSNGGLVVGASAIQRPDLFKLAVPVVGVFDMLRFEKFTVGNFHIDEFGTVSDSTDFVNLLSYSPLHNVKENINYPGMLIITSENDERVPPFHSYKFAAKLQNRAAQKNPILLKTIKRAGHNGSVGLFNNVRETAQFYGYIYEYLTNKE
ncbi:MAG: S9 family peptidase [Bacteroidales bacterium]|nr:S9 family peptidase [Bacteroidales bacterium]